MIVGFIVGDFKGIFGIFGYYRLWIWNGEFVGFVDDSVLEV